MFFFIKRQVASILQPSWGFLILFYLVKRDQPYASYVALCLKQSEKKFRFRFMLKQMSQQQKQQFFLRSGLGS